MQPVGELFVGWGYRLCEWHFGAKLAPSYASFDVTTANTAVNDDPIAIQLTATLQNLSHAQMRNAEYTLDFRPGYVFCDKTLLFATLGGAYNRSRLQATTNFKFLNTSNGERFPLSFQKEKERHSIGFRAGIGLERMLTCCLSILVDYTSTTYWTNQAEISGDITNSFGIVTNGLAARFKAEFYKQVAAIGVAYHF